MAITFVGKGAFGSGTASVSATAVSGVQSGDLLLLFVESANQPITAPSGWTQVTNSPVAIGTANAAGGVALQVFYQFATGADTSTTVGDSGDHTTCIKLAYRGVDPTTPFDATPVSGTKTTASTSSSWPSITTVTADAEIILASALDLDLASTTTTSGYTNANLTGLSEQHDQTIAGGFGGGLVIVDGTKATAGATGATTATVTSTTQTYLTMALRPRASVNYPLTANAGTYSLTGNTATLKRGYSLTAISGSYSYTGVSSTLKVGRILTANAGTYSLIGGSAVLTKATGVVAYTLTADAGSYSYTGGSSVLKVGRTVTANSGSYLLTGETAILSRGLSLTASSGSYNLIGGSSLLNINRNLIANAGSYSLSGGDANLVYFRGVRNYTLTADSSSYIITGTTATLTRRKADGSLYYSTKYFNGTSWVFLIKDPIIF